MQEPWQGCCFDLREQPELLDVMLLWLHAEWLKQRKSTNQNPAEAYAMRRIQLQEHLKLQDVPLTLMAKEVKSTTKPALGCVSLTRLVPSKAHVPSRSLVSNEVKAAADMRVSTEFQNALWLSNLFVTPTARGRGIADALLTAAQVQAKRLGWNEIYLYARSSKAYYLAKGWRELKIKPSPVVIPSLANMSVLTKQLDASCS